MTQVSLDKYVAAYQSECVDGSRKRATLTRLGNDAMSLVIDNDYYSDRACNGSVVGKVSFSAPVILQYTGTSNGGYYYRPPGIVNGGTVETNVPLDRFTAAIADYRIVITGSSLKPGTLDGKPVTCITFDYTTKPQCADVNTVNPGYTTTYAVYLKGATLYLGGPAISAPGTEFDKLHPVLIPYVKM